MESLNWLLNISAICIGLFACIVPLLLKALQRPAKPPDHTDAQEDPLKLVEQYREEVDRMILQYENDSVLNGYIKRVLLIGQYVIGALLTSAFVQRSLPSDIVGGAGLLVLVCSTWNERFRPDLKEKGAKKRAQQLRDLRRAVDNGVSQLRSGLQGAPSAPDILEQIRQTLKVVENSELEEG
jgi:hypothetical protein